MHLGSLRRCPRATRSITPPTRSGRCSRGACPTRSRTPQRRHDRDRWPERLRGRAVHRVEARGKHLLLHFDGDLVVHSHLRMTGCVGGLRRGRALAALAAAGMARDARAGARGRAVRRPAARADDGGAHAHRPAPGGARAGHPRRALRRGAPAFDGSARTTRTRAVGDALIDQRTLAGIGNIWKSESCFAAALDPWKRAVAGRRRGDPRRGALRARAHGAVGARRLPGASAGRLRPRRRAVPALRDADPLRRPGRAEPHDLLVPAMPALIRVGHRGAPALAPDNTHRQLRRGARRRRRHDRVRRPPGARELARALRRARLRGARPFALADAERGARALRHRALRGDPPAAGHQAPRRGAAGDRGAGRQRDALAGLHQHRAARRAAALSRAGARHPPGLDGARHPGHRLGARARPPVRRSHSRAGRRRVCARARSTRSCRISRS